jgi:hypothetical protein
MATGPRHYWRKAIQQSRQGHFEQESAARVPTVCDAAKTLGMLSMKAQDKLGWFATHFAFLTTPFKRLGISGWKETGCTAAALRVPVRDAQHSTDGFWTIDFKLQSFDVGGTMAGTGRFVRVEVEPNTVAHGVCESTRIVAGMTVRFGGPVVVDEDGPFLEVHPDQDFQVQTGSTEPTMLSQRAAASHTNA